MSIVENAFKSATAMRTDGYRYFRMPFDQAVVDELQAWPSRDRIALNGIRIENDVMEIGVDMGFLHAVKPELAELATNLTRLVPYSNDDHPIWHPVVKV